MFGLQHFQVCWVWALCVKGCGLGFRGLGYKVQCLGLQISASKLNMLRFSRGVSQALEKWGLLRSARLEFGR